MYSVQYRSIQVASVQCPVYSVGQYRWSDSAMDISADVPGGLGVYRFLSNKSQSADGQHVTRDVTTLCGALVDNTSAHGLHNMQHARGHSLTH